MGITEELKKKFFDTIEIQNVPWSVVDEVATSDPNVLRPIKGVCFEELFRIICQTYFKDDRVILGPGDSDVDVYLNDFRLQLKTIDKGSTVYGKRIGIALHKTHGLEKRPYNLYKKSEETFDYLVTLHPSQGILVVPYPNIPEHGKWAGYLADPARFTWRSEWLNRWDLLGHPEYQGKNLDNRRPPKSSVLPKLSEVTFLEDHEIIRTLTRPEYFRAAVMGLKGNIKECWLIDHLNGQGITTKPPIGSYPKYDIVVINSSQRQIRTQIKGTSKNMCDPLKSTIGLEVMGTHGRFPERGYKKSYFDYVALVLSEEQIPKRFELEGGLHFLFIPVGDLPLHHLIGKGKDSIETGRGNRRWNHPDNRDVIYPNIKLRLREEGGKIVAFPNLTAYRRGTIPFGDPFRKAGPWSIDEIPQEFT